MSTSTSRGGFALLTTLVTLVLLSAIAVRALTEIGTVHQATQNRLAQTRGEWAARGCLALLQSGYVAPEHPLEVAATELNRNAFCSAVEVNPAARLNVNLTDSMTLARFLDRRTAAAILDWRDADDVDRRGGSERDIYRAANKPPPRNAPFRHPDELLLLHDVDQQRLVDRLASLTVEGDGRLDPNLTSVEILGSLSVLGPAAIEAIVFRRSTTPFTAIAQVQEMIGAEVDASRYFTLDRRTRRVLLTGWGTAGTRTLEVQRTAVLFATESRLGIGRIEIR